MLEPESAINNRGLVNERNRKALGSKCNSSVLVHSPGAEHSVLVAFYSLFGKVYSVLGDEILYGLRTPHLNRVLDSAGRQHTNCWMRIDAVYDILITFVDLSH